MVTNQFILAHRAEASQGTGSITTRILLTLGMIVLIVILATIAYYLQTKFIVPRFGRHRYPLPQGYGVNVENRSRIERILSSIPVVKYRSNIELEQQKDQTDTQVAPSDTTPTNSQLSAQNSQPVQPPRVYPQNSKQDNQSKEEPTSCSICTENFNAGENVRILNCKHIYHRRCIDPWLLDFGGKCPLW
jgi:hypothetical protein